MEEVGPASHFDPKNGDFGGQRPKNDAFWPLFSHKVPSGDLFSVESSMETGGKNELDETGIFDHISMHKDGTVHLTTKKLSGETERLTAAELDQNVFNLNT